MRNPFSGIGRTEPIENQFKGRRPGRITQKHRLVYQVEGDRLLIMQCRFPDDD